MSYSLRNFMGEPPMRIECNTGVSHKSASGVEWNTCLNKKGRRFDWSYGIKASFDRKRYNGRDWVRTRFGSYLGRRDLTLHLSKGAVDYLVDIMFKHSTSSIDDRIGEVSSRLINLVGRLDSSPNVLPSEFRQKIFRGLLEYLSLRGRMELSRAVSSERVRGDDLVHLNLIYNLLRDHSKRDLFFTELYGIDDDLLHGPQYARVLANMGDYCPYDLEERASKLIVPRSTPNDIMSAIVYSKTHSVV